MLRRCLASSTGNCSEASRHLKLSNLKKAEVRFKAVWRAQPKQIAALNLLGVVLTQAVGEICRGGDNIVCQALGQNPNSEATLYNFRSCSQQSLDTAHRGVAPIQLRSRHQSGRGGNLEQSGDRLQSDKSIIARRSLTLNATIAMRSRLLPTPCFNKGNALAEFSSQIGKAPSPPMTAQPSLKPRLDGCVARPRQRARRTPGITMQR